MGSPEQIADMATTFLMGGPVIHCFRLGPVEVRGIDPASCWPPLLFEVVIERTTKSTEPTKNEHML